MERDAARGPHKPVDSLARQVVRANPAGLLPWLTGLAGLTPVRALDTAFVTMQRTTDALWEARLVDGREAIALIEFELVPNAHTPRRVSGYAGVIESTTDLPVIPIVVCLQPQAGGRPLASTFRRGIGRTSVVRRFIVVNIWQTPVATAFEPGLEGLLPFVPFMRGSDSASVARALQLLESHDWGEDIRLLMLYLVQRLRGPEGLAELGRQLNMQTLRHAPWYAEILQEGLEKGLEQGLEQGRALGRADLLLRLCEERFAPLTVAERDWLAGLSEQDMIAAAPLVYRTSSMQELRQRLERH